ncbi:DUF2127 domain-containing protein [Actinokineospora sp. 24-640]
MFFRLVVVLKGADGVAQVLGALLLAIVSPAVITGVANAVLTRDLIGDVDGALAHHVARAAHHFAEGGTRIFVIGYLLAHGLVKLVLAVAMLRGRAAAFPLAMVAMSAFIVFECARAVRTGSFALLVLAAFDLLVLVLVVREFARKQRLSSGAGAALRQGNPPHRRA